MTKQVGKCTKKWKTNENIMQRCSSREKTLWILQMTIFQASSTQLMRHGICEIFKKEHFPSRAWNFKEPVPFSFLESSRAIPMLEYITRAEIIYTMHTLVQHFSIQILCRRFPLLLPAYCLWDLWKNSSIYDFLYIDNQLKKKRNIEGLSCFPRLHERHRYTLT